MTTRTPRDPIAMEIATMTGLGYRQVWKAAREGRIPVTIEGRRMSMTDGQRERLNREGVRPVRTEQAADHPLAPSFIRQRRAS